MVIVNNYSDAADVQMQGFLSFSQSGQLTGGKGYKILNCLFKLEIIIFFLFLIFFSHRNRFYKKKISVTYRDNGVHFHHCD